MNKPVTKPQSIDWDDPAARAKLIEQVGPAEYERLQQEHFTDSTIIKVNGYAIRPVQSSRFGRIFMIHGTGTGYSTLQHAMDEAAKLPRASE